MTDDKESLEAQRKQKENTLKLMDTSQVETEKLDEEKVQEPSEDIDPSEFTEHAPDSAYGPEEKASPEVSKETRSKRFSKDIPIDEEALRENARKTDTTKDETDKPSD